jgi:beta-glucanase (GH16 family)
MTRTLKFILSCALATACNSPPEDVDPTSGKDISSAEFGPWQVVWKDDFDGPAGTPPDARRWGYDIGGSGWGNRQLEFDTDSPENAQLDGSGALVITALKKRMANNAYTSARLTTKGKFEQTYGKFEARIKLPRGKGIWPAFWLLGNDIATVGWPACGEIDIMELRGSEPSEVHGSLHGPGYSGGDALSQSLQLAADAGTFADDFHVFTLEWNEARLRWSVDGKAYHERTKQIVDANGGWVFDHPMFVILNLAIGGTYDGDPDATTTFPQHMVVDYVSVSARK